MAGQFQELLVRVAAQLQALEKLLEVLQKTDERQDRALDEIRKQIAAFERDLDWIARAREEVNGKLQTGDHTFKRLEAKVESGERKIKELLERLHERGTTRRTRFLWKLLEHAAPMIVGFLFWLMYHILLVGPKIAQAMKQSGGHP